MLIHRLFMDAMKWDDETMKVVDSVPGEMNPVSQTSIVRSWISPGAHDRGLQLTVPPHNKLATLNKNV